MKGQIVPILFLAFWVVPAMGQVEAILKLKNSLPAITDSLQYVNTINKIALLSYEQDIDTTFFYGIRAREISTRHQYQRGIAGANNNLGVVFDLKGNMQLALRYYNDAYNRYRELGDSSNMVQTTMNIGLVYSLTGKNQKAVVSFEQALAMGNRISNDSINAIVIYNYILSYPNRFNSKQKDVYIDKARKISAKYHDTRISLALQQLVADKMIAEGQKEKGIRLLESTLRSSTDMQLYYLSMDLLIELGNIYLKIDEEKGISFFTRALRLAEEKKYRVYAMDISHRLYDLYAKKGDDAHAYLYTKKLVRLYQVQAILDEGSGVDYIQYAVKEEQLATEKVKSAYKSDMLWLAITICVLTILSIIFLLRNWWMSKRNNEVLQMQFRQLESTTEALVSSNENYAKLIKVVAHDLRNPIGAISSLSTLLLEDHSTPAETHQFAQLIHESSVSCSKLIADLLEADFSFTESELHKEEINLSSFLKQAVKLLSFRASEKNQNLILVKDAVNTIIMADRDKLLRALNNLIVNAIKFSPEGSSIYVETKRSAEGVVISVKDKGVGISKLAGAKIFDPFTTAMRAGTAGEAPFGLGLYITKQIIEAHHGRIWFESEPEKGTTFFVMLPNEPVAA